MLQVIAYAVIASLALPLGALAGTRLKVPKRVLAMLLGFASGALITAVAFELFDEAFEHGGVGRAGISFLVGATTFVLSTAGWKNGSLPGRVPAPASGSLCWPG